MGLPLLSSIPRTRRTLYHTRWRLAALLFIVAFFEQQWLFFVHRQSLAAKYSPTIFNSSIEDSHLSRPDDEDAAFQDELIADRAMWETLGEGWESKVFAYQNSVIKTFRPNHSPFRNCVPGVPGEKWPTEIGASLRFGGHDTVQRSNISGFLPVKAYFKSPSSPYEPSKWHLVTPLVANGNLNTLSQTLVRRPKAETFRDLDTRYRAAFNQILGHLDILHQEGYCHDDIKPANIFVEDDMHWILGDLGSLRHISHPYHTSRLWKANNQLEDCRANDVARALKSYLNFISSSASDQERFNEELFQGREPLSRLFGELTTSSRISATGMREKSFAEYPEQAYKYNVRGMDQPSTLLGLFSRRLALRHAVNRALATKMDERIARFWAMTWVFGTPESDACGE